MGQKAGMGSRSPLFEPASQTDELMAVIRLVSAQTNFTVS